MHPKEWNDVEDPSLYEHFQKNFKRYLTPSLEDLPRFLSGAGPVGVVLLQGRLELGI